MDKTNNIKKLDEEQELQKTEISEEINLEDIILKTPMSLETKLIGENKYISRGLIDNPAKNSNPSKSIRKKCCKYDVTNWLEDIEKTNIHSKFNIVEVRFKNSRKDFFKLPSEGFFYENDIVLVEALNGSDIGIITLMGDIVKLQMQKKKVDIDSTEIKKIFRKARAYDIEKWVGSILQEDKTLTETKKISNEMNLNMKFNDIEYQGDGSKAIFYYSSEDRVDFRELIKILAEKFRVRVEMRQIGIRQEASRLGGIGSCGREICCSSWLSNFISVSTNIARNQQLILNPQKLTGQCGKLKCCLNFENETYNQEYKTFPNTNIILKTEKGDCIYNKTDIIKKIMWYSYANDPYRLFALPKQQVETIINENKKGKLVKTLEDYSIIQQNKSEIDFNLEDDINKFDKSIED